MALSDTPCCVQAVTVFLFNKHSEHNVLTCSGWFFFHLSSVSQRSLWMSRCDADVVPCLPDDAVHAASSRWNPPETLDYDSRGASSRCRQVWPWAAATAPVFPPTSFSKLNFQAVSLSESKLWRQQKTTQTNSYLWDPAMTPDSDLLTQDIFRLVLQQWPSSWEDCQPHALFCQTYFFWPCPITAALTCELYSIILCLVHSRLNVIILALIHSTFSVVLPCKNRIFLF